MNSFKDGLTNIINKLANRRSAPAANMLTHTVMPETEMQAAYLSGVGNKIVSIKSGYALNDTLQFGTDTERAQFNKYALAPVKLAAKMMLAFGRSIIVVFNRGDDLAVPASGSIDISRARIRVFDGGMVTVGDINLDLSDPRYLKPRYYMVRGKQIHYSRVIDFTYIKPPERDAGLYRWGGVSEFEIIRDQLANDAVVERASATIIEKNSTVYNKVVGFKDAIESGNEDTIISYCRLMADMRSIYGDGIIDAEDDVISVAQTLTNLSDANNITLSRLAFVTGIPVSEFIGEQAKGINSTGEADRLSLSSTIENLQSEYLLDPITQLAAKFGIVGVEFKEIQSESVSQRATVEKQVVETAVQLSNMGEDYRPYLERYNMKTTSPLDDFFAEVDDVTEVDDATEVDEVQPDGAVQ